MSIINLSKIWKKMNKIIVNSQSYEVSGNNVVVNRKTISVDGKVVHTCGVGESTVKVIWEGPLAKLDCVTAEIIGDVSGDVDGTTIKITGNVGKNVDGTSVTIGGSVHGDVDSVSCTIKNK